MNGLALCAGYGGIELALERVIPGFRTVCYVEGEAYAASHLIKKMEEGRLHPAPIWDDLRTFEGSRWRGKVDIISGGFPCQPFSVVGKQLGDKDPRHLWPNIVGIIGEVRPRYLFFENVPGIVRWILSDILNDLTELGYNASWCVMGASDVGAPHRRKRWFLLAQMESTKTDGASQIDSNTNRRRSQKVQSSSSRGTWQFDPSRSCFVISDPECERLEGSIEQEVNRSQEIFSKASRFGERVEEDRWNGKFHEWWKVEPGMGRLADGVADWVDKIRILGNGVVPQQAAYAFQILAARLAAGRVENRTPRL